MVRFTKLVSFYTSLQIFMSSPLYKWSAVNLYSSLLTIYLFLFNRFLLTTQLTKITVILSIVRYEIIYEAPGVLLKSEYFCLTHCFCLLCIEQFQSTLLCHAACEAPLLLSFRGIKFCENCLFIATDCHAGLVPMYVISFALFSSNILFRKSSLFLLYLHHLLHFYLTCY